jgi:erythromycin esterase-like protein
MLVRVFVMVLAMVGSREVTAAGRAEAEPNPVRLQSIHPAHPDDADLAPVAAAVGSARVVVLAIPDWGDGGSLWAAGRVTQFLIRAHGFSVVCFDAGLYDCRAMNDQFAAGTDPTLAPALGLPDALARSGATQGLWRDVWKSYLTRQPVAFAGLSPRFSGSRTARQLPRDLLDFLGSIDPHPLTRDQRRTYLTVLERLDEATAAADEPEIVRAWQHLSELRTVLHTHQDALSAANSPADFAWWERIVRDAIMNAEARMTSVGDESGHRAREQQRMVEHLAWLAEAVYPGRRIVVWSRAASAVRSMEAVAFEPAMDAGHSPVAAGTGWSAAMGREMYVLLMTAASGARGGVREEPADVRTPPAGSLEEKLAKLDWPFLFVNFRADDGPPKGFEGFMPSTAFDAAIGERAFGNGIAATALAQARWAEQVDGVVFIRTTFPNSNRSEGPPGATHTVLTE